jgi:hypothetical protein
MSSAPIGENSVASTIVVSPPSRISYGTLSQPEEGRGAASLHLNISAHPSSKCCYNALGNMSRGFREDFYLAVGRIKGRSTPNGEPRYSRGDDLRYLGGGHV